VDRTALLLAVLVTLLVAVGCGSTVDVRHDYDKKEDFGKLKTWRWLPLEHAKNDPMAQDPALAKKVRTEIHRELTAKGYEWVESRPDFHVGFHTSLQEKQDVAVMARSYGDAYRGSSPEDSGTQTLRYYEGTLVVDIVDVGRDELVWRGWASAVVTPGEPDDARLREAIQSLIANFPPTEAVQKP
jgi:hypothetical protein